MYNIEGVVKLILQILLSYLFFMGLLQN